jgi:hypothetical protein
MEKSCRVGDEPAAVGIGTAFLKRGRGARIGVHVVPAAKPLEQRARFVDDHGIDVEPSAIAGRQLERGTSRTVRVPQLSGQPATGS